MKKITAACYIILGGLILSISCKKSNIPVANFTFSGNVTNSTTAEVHFTNLSSGANSYTWDFGDGSPRSNEENPVHKYTKKNVYKVTLWVNSSSGVSVQIDKIVNFGISLPSIDFVGSDSIVVKEMAVFTIHATFKSDTNVLLKSCEIYRRFGVNGSWSKYHTASLNVPSYIFDVTSTLAPIGISQITYKFVVKDNKDNTTTKYYNIFIVPNTGPWGKVDVVSGTLWNEWVSAGQFWSVTDSKGYGISSAKVNAANIDFVFGHKSVAAGGAILGSPVSVDAKSLYDNAGPDRLSSWNVLNATTFKLTTLSTNEFSQCNNDSLILYNTTSVVNPSCRNIEANNIMAFMASSGRRGLLWVKSVSGDFEMQQSGGLEFEYKIQK